MLTMAAATIPTTAAASPSKIAETIGRSPPAAYSHARPAIRTAAGATNRTPAAIPPSVPLRSQPV